MFASADPAPAATADTVPLRALTVRHWGAASGLPEETFASALAMGDGYLWLAASQGLVRFDGAKAKVFRPGDAFRNDGGGCASNGFTAIQRASNGSIWLGSNSGCIFNLRPDRFGTFANFRVNVIAPGNPDREARPIQLFHSTQAKGEKAFYIGRRNSVEKFTQSESLFDRLAAPEQQQMLRFPKSLALQSLAQDAAGRTFVALNDSKLHVFDPGATEPSQIYALPSTARRVVYDPAGSMWIATANGLVRLRDGKQEVWTTRNGLPQNDVYGLSVDPRGCVWMGFPQAVARLCGETIESIAIGEAEEELLWTFEFDPNGVVWIAGRWGNLYALTPAIFRAYGQKEGMPESHFTGTVVDRQGYVWGSMRSRGLVRLKNGKLDATFDNPVFSTAQAMLAHPDGGIIAGTASGLYHVKGNSFAPLDLALPNAGSTMDFRSLPAMIAIDDDTFVHSSLGSNYRLRRMRNGGRERWKVELIHGPNRARQFAKDPQGRVWAVMQYAGLHELTGDRYQPAPNSGTRRARSWFSLFADKSGLLWVGSGDGLEVYSPVQKRFLTRQTLLEKDQIFQIVEDRFGKIWCATREGLVRFARQPVVDALLKDAAVDLQAERYGESQTLTTRNFGLGTSSSGAVDRDGSIWLSGLLGLVRFDPADFERKPRPPAPTFLSLRVNGTERDLNQSSSLGSRVNRLEIGVQLIRMDPLGGEFCRTRLIGYDPDWVPCGETYTAQYARLQPGDYEFEVQASSKAGHWEAPPLRMPFSIEAAFYERAAVQWAGAVTALALLGFYFWRRHEHRVQLTRELEAKVAERTERLAQATDEAQAASRAKMEFLATMSHEIRTPMNGVLGALQLLEDSALNEDQRQLIGVVRKSGDDLVNIVDDILNLSKADAGKLMLERVPVSIPALCENLITLFHAKAKSQHIALSYELDATVPDVILSDPQRMRQVLLNLVGNAVKFTEHGEVRLLVMKDAEAKRIVFDVRDTGPGIPEEKIPKLFDPFVQADSSTTRKYGGSGLGLAIVKRFVEAMQGSVEVESEVGAGTVFRVRLPLELPSLAKPDSAPAADTPGIAGVESVPQGLNVLLVEDNATNQMLFHRMLLRLGCQVFLAGNGAEALDHLKRNDVDLVLMDCRMPVLDGFAATRQLRAMGGKYADLPVIAITASAMNEDRKACLEAGMSDFLSKPLMLNALTEKLSLWSKA